MTLTLEFQQREVFIQRRYRSVRNFSAILSIKYIFFIQICVTYVNKLKTILLHELWLHAHWFISICSLTWILRILRCLRVQGKYFSFISCRNTEYPWAWHPLLQRLSALPFQHLDISLALGKILRLSLPQYLAHYFHICDTLITASRIQYGVVKAGKASEISTVESKLLSTGKKLSQRMYFISS